MNMATLETDKADFAYKVWNFNCIMPHDNSFRPIPRSSHCILVTTQYIYVIGGYNRKIGENEFDQLRTAMDREWRNPILNDIWRFSKLTKTWTYLYPTGDGPNDLASDAAVFKNSNTIVVYGGPGINGRPSNRIYELNLKTMHWSQVLPINIRNNGDIPNPLYDQLAVIDDKGENLIVSGDIDSRLQNLNVYQFNFEKREWTRLAVAPEAEKRYLYTMAHWDEKVFIFAGAASNAEVMPMDKILILDLQTNNWIKSDASPFIDAQSNRLFPDGRFGHGSAQLGDTVYITGGRNRDGYLDDFWSLHLPSLHWTKHGFKLPTPLGFHAMAITKEGELTIFGGNVGTCPSSQDVEYTNLVHRTWMKIPSLKTMAMEATVVAIQNTLNQHPDRNGNVQHVTRRLLADYIAPGLIPKS